MEGTLRLLYPGWLWLLIPVGILLWLGIRYSLAGLSGYKKWAVLGIRFLGMLLLVIALTIPVKQQFGEEAAVMVVVDRSASVDSEHAEKILTFVNELKEEAELDDAFGAVQFAAESEIWINPGTREDIVALKEFSFDTKKTQMQDALRFASVILPERPVRRLVLVSDGNSTQEVDAVFLEQLRAEGISVDTVLLENASRSEVLVSEVRAPARVRNGQAFDIDARVDSTFGGTVEISLYRNQFLLEKREVQLQPGENQVKFENQTSDQAFSVYEVEVVSMEDTEPGNNRNQVVVASSGKPKVLLVESEERRTEYLAGALRSAQMEVSERHPAGVPITLEDLQQFDLLILSDVSAMQLDVTRMNLIQRWVRDFGGGFLMLGGDNSFGAGGYFRSPIEEILPVRVEHDDRQESPTVALLVILDRSGSMSATLPSGETKISLANQGAVYAAEVLSSRDYFGLFAVDTQVRKVVHMQRAGQLADAAEQIRAIQAGGGGIYIYTSLEEGFRTLREVNARVKHIILFSDASDAEEKVSGEMTGRPVLGANALDLATAMVNNQITISVVALGRDSDRDTAFLKALADRGNGRFYLTSDALTLPQIFTSETMKVAQSSLVEAPILAVPIAVEGVLDGFDWNSVPLLLGYNATKIKPGANVLLATEFGDPLLATWRYGLGTAAAFTSDARNRWASEWIPWSGFQPFWAQLTRHVMREGNSNPMEFQIKEMENALELTVDAITPDGAFRNDIPVKITAADSAGYTFTVDAEQIAPGRYQAEIPLPEAPALLFSVQTGEQNESPASFGYTHGYAQEFYRFQSTPETLQKISQTTGGISNPTPEQVFRREGAKKAYQTELTPWFLIGALLLLPIDIWLRR